MHAIHVVGIPAVPLFRGLLLGVLLLLGSACNPGAREARTLRDVCADGKPGGCVLLADRLYQGNQVLRDRPRATDLYQRACDLGDARGCLRLAEMHLDEDAAVSADRDVAEVLLETGCEMENAQSCIGLADNFRRGALAVDLYQQICDQDEPEGCMKLGVMLAEGRQTRADPEQAAVLFEQACDAEFRLACTRLGESYAEGVGVEQDFNRATALYTEACREVMAACFNLAELYATGEGVEQDYTRAAGLYETACDGNAEIGGRVSGMGEACARLGDLYANGQGVERDLSRASRTLARACRLDYTEACR